MRTKSDARAKRARPGEGRAATAALVDELGEITTRRKALEEREKELKAELQARGAPAVHLGATWSATMTVSDRSYTDWREIVEVSKVAPELIEAHTEVRRVLVCNLARIAPPA